MSTAPWAGSKTPVGPPTSENPTVRFLVYAAIVTGTWSGLLSLVVYGVARLLGVDFVATRGGDAVPEPVRWGAILLVPLAGAIVFALLASLVRGWPHAGPITWWAGTALAVVSLWIPLDQPAEVPWSSRFILASMHAITWFLVVPQIARIIGDSEPERSVERLEP
jgi:hypothetical protein